MKPTWLRCGECGGKFLSRTYHGTFCTRECRQTFHNRRVKGGLALYDAVMRWRIERPTEALRELTQIADQLATEERIVRSRRVAQREKRSSK